MESAGAVLFEYVECSDPTAVQGLPVMRLVQELEKFSIQRS
jgi:predicted house-cleaning NTP pyrophosphatase (Maf/HAM1 superfamily)